jgi:flagellum-specific ATP synthase
MEGQLQSRWNHLRKTVSNTGIIERVGRVTSVVGLVIQVEGIRSSVGEVCKIIVGGRDKDITAEVVGFKDDKLLLMPFEKTTGIGEGCEVLSTGVQLKIPVGNGLLGRVIGPGGEPIDGKGRIRASESVTIQNTAPSPLEREPIDSIMESGIKVIDTVVPCGIGQRMGIFSGSGVGKSILLGMICRHSSSDVNVVALIGERGREVGEFVNNVRGEKGLRNSVVVAVTSDRSPVSRVKGAESAMAIAEYFRDRGLNVLFLMDSITRYAMAQREIGLSVGEPPTSRGYTTSVFAKLPALLERAGRAKNGSITGLYSVLVEGDDVSADPLTDSIRAILDGHVVLSRSIANSGIYPAVDILNSVSRLAPILLTREQSIRRDKVIKWYSDYREAEDLINIGAYQKGSSTEIDEAIEMTGRLNRFFSQGIRESFSFEKSEQMLSQIINQG